MKHKIFILLGIVTFVTGLFICGTPAITLSNGNTANSKANTLTQLNSTINTFDHNKVYLAFKGTNSKPGNIAKNYNIKNKDVSHVGLLYFEDSWKVMHVTNSRKNNNNLYVESAGEYYDTINNPTYASVFEVKGLRKDEIIEKIHEFSAKKIYFDLKFDNSNDKYYCSEFVIHLIDKKGSLNLSLAKKAVVNIQHKYFLGKDTLEYYPVDIFYNNKNFIKKYETKF